MMYVLTALIFGFAIFGFVNFLLYLWLFIEDKVTDRERKKKEKKERKSRLRYINEYCERNAIGENEEAYALYLLKCDYPFDRIRRYLHMAHAREIMNKRRKEEAEKNETKE